MVKSVSAIVDMSRTIAKLNKSAERMNVIGHFYDLAAQLRRGGVDRTKAHRPVASPCTLFTREQTTSINS